MDDAHEQKSLHDVLGRAPAARHAQYEEFAIDELSTAYTTDHAMREWHLGRAQVFAFLAQAAAIADLRDALESGAGSSGVRGG